MALELLKIDPVDPSQLETVTVLFNPNSYSIVKTVTWNAPNANPGNTAEAHRRLNAPPLEFGGGGSRQLTLELFFDVTESGQPRELMDVRNETNKVVALTRIERKQGRPP